MLSPPAVNLLLARAQALRSSRDGCGGCARAPWAHGLNAELDGLALELRPCAPSAAAAATATATAADSAATASDILGRRPRPPAPPLPRGMQAMAALFHRALARMRITLDGLAVRLHAADGDGAEDAPPPPCAELRVERLELTPEGAGAAADAVAAAAAGSAAAGNVPHEACKVLRVGRATLLLTTAGDDVDDDSEEAAAAAAASAAAAAAATTTTTPPPTASRCAVGCVPDELTTVALRLRSDGSAWSLVDADCCVRRIELLVTAADLATAAPCRAVCTASSSARSGGARAAKAACPRHR